MKNNIKTTWKYWNCRQSKATGFYGNIERCILLAVVIELREIYTSNVLWMLTEKVATFLEV